MKPLKLYQQAYVPWLLSLFLSLSPQSQNAQALVTNNIIPNEKSPVYLRLNEVNAHAARHFVEHFGNDSPEKWMRIGPFYVATRNSVGSFLKAYYSRKGVFMYSMQSFDESTLDDNIKADVEKRFPEAEIVTAIEIESRVGNALIIKIKKDGMIKTLRSSEGKMEVIDSFIYDGI